MDESALSESVLRHHPTAFVGVDAENRVSYANRTARQLLNGGDPIDGRDIVELFCDDDTLARGIRSALDNRREERLSLTLESRDRRIEIGMTLSPRIEASRELVLVVAFRDLQERKALEDRQRHREQFELAARMAGGFAHQLRNPLAAISALTENLAAEIPDDDPRIEYITRLLNQVRFMEDLIRDSLQFGLDSGGVRQRTTVKSIAQEAMASFEEQAGGRPGLRIDSRARDVFVCKEQITRCLGLLLERAYNSCGSTSKVELWVSSDSKAPDRFVCFTVRDRGPGIEKAHLDRIFEPFFTNKATGVGLGLAVAQALAVHNGGSLGVRSKSGDTRLTLRLRAVTARGAPPLTSEIPTTALMNELP